MIRLHEIIFGHSGAFEAGRGSSHIRGIAIAAGLLATIGSSLSVYPHQLAYFNEVSGGPESGHKHLLGSNLDWGQDLLLLKEWIRDHPQVSSVSFSFNGYYEPKSIGLRIEDFEGWRSLNGNSDCPCWAAVSLAHLNGRKSGAPPIDCRFLHQFSPVSAVGRTILIYALSPSQAIVLKGDIEK